MCTTPVAVSLWSPSFFLFFFFNDTATTEIYTLSLHDALPISRRDRPPAGQRGENTGGVPGRGAPGRVVRSEEHTSELQSQSNLVCRLLLEKKKKKKEDKTRAKKLKSRVSASDIRREAAHDRRR